MLNDEIIYQQILKAIVEHDLAPGVRLPEDKLSEAFGISRTGIRKVLQRLALERFVIIEPNKGAHVNNPSKQEAEEVLNSRTLIEPLLIDDILKHWGKATSERFRAMIAEEHQAEHDNDLAASIQLTARFHIELAKLSNNSILAEFVEQLSYRSSLVIAAYGSKDSVSCDCGDHGEILDLLDNHQVQEAKQWMQNHLGMIKSSLNLDDSPNSEIDFKTLFSKMD